MIRSASTETAGKMAAHKKTNAARILDGLSICYELLEYHLDEADFSAEAAAQCVNLPPEQVFKTLVVRGDKTGVLMVCLPATSELSPKKLAAASANKQVEMVPIKEIQPLTGYIRGGCSPIGTKKKYPVYIDQSCEKLDHIAVNAGHQGVLFLISTKDLLAATAGVVADVCK